jgi:hypothetical protein
MREKENRVIVFLIGLILGIILLMFTGCGETTTKAESYSDTQGVVRISTGAFSRVEDIREFEYKGHTYLCTEVRDGVSITHAGHCKCNTK